MHICSLWCTLLMQNKELQYILIGIPIFIVKFIEAILNVLNWFHRDVNSSQSGQEHRIDRGF